MVMGRISLGGVRFLRERTVDALLAEVYPWIDLPPSARFCTFANVTRVVVRVEANLPGGPAPIARLLQFQHSLTPFN